MPAKRAPSRVIDPRSRLPTVPRDAIISSFRQTQEGKQNIDAVGSFTNECFVVTHSMTSSPHAAIASKLACDTAVWGYKQERQCKLYWKNKQLIPGRIFQITNLTLWNKQRETGYEEGIYATMAIAMVGNTTAWVASLGDMGIFLLREKKLIRLIRQYQAGRGRMNRVLGEDRKKLVPSLVHFLFRAQDAILMVTSSVTDRVPVSDMSLALEQAGNTSESLDASLAAILAKAGKGEHTLCLLKRIALPR